MRLAARFLLLCAGVWLHSADTLVTATIAPNVVLQIGGVEYINWTIALYEVGAIIAGAAAGMLCGRFGVKRVLIAATLLYGSGCVMAALAASMAVVVGGRFIQGLGGGMLLSLCYLAIHAWFAPSLWNRLFSVVALIWGAGSLLGPLIGGVFANHYTWRGAFWFFAFQAALLSLIAGVWLPAESPQKNAPSGWPFAPLLVLSAATLIIAEVGVITRPALSIAGCLLGAGLLYVAARLDRRSRVRLLPAQLLDLRHPVGAGLMMVFALSMATTGFWAYGPLILKTLFGTNALISGYILAVEALAWSLATLAVSKAPPTAEQLLIRSGASIVAAGAAGFAIAVPSGSLPGMIVCAFLQGLGFGACWPSIVHRMVRFADVEEQSLGAASSSVIQRIGYAVGTAAAGIAANLSGLGEGMSVAAVRAAAFWVFAGFIPILVAALICAWRFTANFAQHVPVIGSAPAGSEEFVHPPRGK
jgi:MFS family permease